MKRLKTAFFITIISLLSFSGVAFADFTASDLEGTWNFHDIVSGDSPQWSGWAYGQITCDAAGQCTMASVQQSDGGSSQGYVGETWTFVVSSNGIVTSPGSSIHGAMNTGKDLIVLTGTDDTGSAIFTVMQKTGGTFSTEDLQGTWNFHGIISGDSPQWNGWYYGRLNIIAGGDMTFLSLRKSNGDTTLSDETSVSLTSDGVFTYNNDPAVHGVMSPGKDLIVGIDTEEKAGGGYELFIIQKKGGRFKPSNLAGKWNYHGIISGDAPEQKPGWYYGAVTFNSKGKPRFSPVTDSMGNIEFIPRTPSFKVNSKGTVTIPGAKALSFNGAMNIGKDLIAATATMAPGRKSDVNGYNLLVMQKASPESVANTYTLTVTKSGTGSGTVISKPKGINCGNNCIKVYRENTMVTLTATPASGSTFAGWSGDCSGKNCTVKMNRSRFVTAVFNKKSSPGDGWFEDWKTAPLGTKTDGIPFDADSGEWFPMSYGALNMECNYSSVPVAGQLVLYAYASSRINSECPLVSMAEVLHSPQSIPVFYLMTKNTILSGKWSFLPDPDMDTGDRDYNIEGVILIGIPEVNFMLLYSHNKSVSNALGVCRTQVYPNPPGKCINIEDNFERNIFDDFVTLYGDRFVQWYNDNNNMFYFSVIGIINSANIDPCPSGPPDWGNCVYYVNATLTVDYLKIWEKN